MALDQIIQGFVSRRLPTPTIDGMDSFKRLRLSRYGDNVVSSLVPTKHQLAEEGSYFTAGVPTSTSDPKPLPGATTQLAANINAFSDTNGLFVFRNNEPISPLGKSIYLDFLSLLLGGTAPTGTVSMEFAAAIDTIERAPTAANAKQLLIPQNTGDGGVGSIATVYAYANAAAMTVIAGSNQRRIVGRAHLSTGLGIVGDEYLVQFGAADLGPGMMGLTAARATVPAKIVGHAPPCAVRPGESLVIHMWWLTSATTAATFEYSLGWWER